MQPLLVNQLDSEFSVSSSRVMATTNELCPNCGEFVVDLNYDTGWCDECTEQVRSNEGGNLCRRCLNQVGDLTHRYCRVCRTLRWLEEYANEIERHMATGLTVEVAIDKVKSNGHPSCLLCGGKMRRSTRGVALFCTQPACRKAYRRLVHLEQKHGLDRKVALPKLLEELGVNRT